MRLVGIKKSQHNSGFGETWVKTGWLRKKNSKNNSLKQNHFIKVYISN